MGEVSVVCKERRLGLGRRRIMTLRLISEICNHIRYASSTSNPESRCQRYQSGYFLTPLKPFGLIEITNLFLSDVVLPLVPKAAPSPWVPGAPI